LNTALGRLALLLALASLPLASRPAAAQAFVVSPTAYNINPVTSNTSQVRFENQGTQPMRFRVEVMRWSTENGAYVYTPTRDVIVNPPEFDLAPGAAQVIRIGVLKKVGGDELTYRVFIRQEPTSGLTPATSDSKDVQIALNNLSTVTLPVYLTPPASAPDVHAHVTGSAAAGLTLQLANAGNRHLTYQATCRRRRAE